MATYLKELYCPKCDKTYEASRPQNLCECGTPLLVRYDLGRLAKEVNPDVWKGDPGALALPWRFPYPRKKTCCLWAREALLSIH